MKFVKLTSMYDDNHSIYVNMDSVSSIEDIANGNLITFTNGDKIKVKENLFNTANENKFITYVCEDKCLK